jgi:hypothetical protein
MNDMWVLSLDHMAKLKPKVEVKVAACLIVLSTDERENPWYWTCGKYGDINTNDECKLEDVLRMAWCREQYNSFIDLGNAHHEINPYAEIICGLNAHGE